MNLKKNKKLVIVGGLLFCLLSFFIWYEFTIGKLTVISGYVAKAENAWKDIDDAPVHYVFTIVEEDGSNVKVQYRPIHGNRVKKNTHFESNLKLNTIVGRYMVARGEYFQRGEDTLLITNVKGGYLFTYSNKEVTTKSSATYAPNVVLTKFVEGTSNERISEIIRAIGGEGKVIHTERNIYIINFENGNVEDIIQQIETYPEVEYAEPNYLRSAD